MKQTRVASLHSKRLAVAAAGFAVATLATTAAHANGFFLYEVSARGMAQGGATIADASEPATLFYNPAGMTQLPGLQLQAGVTTYISANNYTAPGGKREDAETGVFPLPNFFATYRAHPKLSVGIGGYSVYGLGITWPDRWSGYQLTKKAQLSSYSVQPSVAYELVKGLSIGAGADFLRGAVDISRGLPLGSGSWGTLRLGGSAIGVGYNAGVFYTPSQTFRFGLTYRSPITVNLDNGKADFTVPAAYDKQLADQSFTSSLKLPGVVGAGARVTLDKLQVELDAVLVLWSTYDKLTFNFRDPSLSQTQNKDWKNAFQLRLGSQYELGKSFLRAGVIYDQNPIPNATLDPTLPDTDRIDVCVGGGHTLGKFTIDAAYMMDYLFKRSVGASDNPFPGKYDGVVHVIALSGVVRL